MPDVQSEHDQRETAIDRVGIKNLRYPIVVRDRARGTQATVAMIEMCVDLPHHFRGTHMSRFLEVLNGHHRSMSFSRLDAILCEMKNRLDAESAYLKLTFPYFIERAAPVTGARSLSEYQCSFEGAHARSGDFVLGVTTGITTLCPCSKEIAERGAHNQRGEVRLRVRPREDLWLEDLIDLVESSGSGRLYSLLKREDEKAVTEWAYDHPAFCEDVVRAVAWELDRNPNILWYDVESEHFESIHFHNAYARITRDKRETRGAAGDGEGT